MTGSGSQGRKEPRLQLEEVERQTAEFSEIDDYRGLHEDGLDSRCRGRQGTRAASLVDVRDLHA